MPLETAFVSKLERAPLQSKAFASTGTAHHIQSAFYQLANEAPRARMDAQRDVAAWQANVSGTGQSRQRMSVMSNQGAGHSRQYGSMSSQVTTIVQDFATMTPSSLSSRTPSSNNVLSGASSPRIGSQGQDGSSSGASSTKQGKKDASEVWGTTQQKKKGGFLSFLSTKEPSAMAFAEMQKAAQEEAKRKKTTGVAVSRAEKMPDHVPKVNSKWDGMPQNAKAEAQKAATRARSGSTGISNLLSFRDENDVALASPQKPIDADAATRLAKLGIHGDSSEEAVDFHFPPHPSVVVPKPPSSTNIPALTPGYESPQEYFPPQTPPTPSTALKSNIGSIQSKVSSTPPASGLRPVQGEKRANLVPWESFEPPASEPRTESKSVGARSSTAVHRTRPSATVGLVPLQQSKREDAAPWELQEPPEPATTPRTTTTDSPSKSKGKKMSLFGRK